MNRHPALAAGAAILTGLLLLHNTVSQGEPAARRADPIATRDLSRTRDPIVLRGAAVRPMLGLALCGFRLFAARGGSLDPVPFQIDEVDEDGLYVLPRGKDPNRDTGRRGEEDELEGALDGNDEIVFMAEDLGDRVGREAWPAGVRKGMEIEVSDPESAGKGWAYLFWSIDNPPPESSRDYVRYSPEEDRIHAAGFTLGYSPERDLVYTTSMAVAPAGAGSGEDLLDRINIRFSATILLGAVTLSRTEDDFVSSVIAYKDGPVRAMRRVKNSMRLVAGLRTPKIIAYSMYYRDSIEAPNRIDIPVAIAAVARDVHFEGGSDYNRRAMGMRFYTSNDRQGVLVDGRMSPEEQALNRGDHDWTVIAGPQGGLLARIALGSGLREVLGKELIYVDDLLGPNGPEDEVGTVPRIAFSFTRLLALKKGRYDYNVHFYILPRYRPGAEKEYLDILDHPLLVRALP
ncbi:MAG: hypothetical protein AB1640_17570 [bacterium]